MIIILKGFARVFEHKRDLNYAAKRFMQQQQQQKQSQRIAVILAKLRPGVEGVCWGGGGAS